MKLPVVYLSTDRWIREEYNGEGETTHYIAGRICLEGSDEWIECLVIWSER